jgi:hypothetical protein
MTDLIDVVQKVDRARLARVLVQAGIIATAVF